MQNAKVKMQKPGGKANAKVKMQNAKAGREGKSQNAKAGREGQMQGSGMMSGRPTGQFCILHFALLISPPE
jgi:hypothetical protein